MVGAGLFGFMINPPIALYYMQVMHTFRWLRMPGDSLFAIGAIAFVLFVFGLRLGYSTRGGAARQP